MSVQVDIKHNDQCNAKNIIFLSLERNNQAKIIIFLFLLLDMSVHNLNMSIDWDCVSLYLNVVLRIYQLIEK